MSALLPLLAAAPAVTGIAGYVVRDFRGITPVPVPTATETADARPPTTTAPARPQTEYFDIAALNMTDPRGFVRPIDRARVEPWGLYVARTVDGPPMRYLESWLLTDLGLRVDIAHDQPGHHRDQDYCLRIGQYTRIEPKRWKAVDQQLSIAVRHGRKSELRGADELLKAHAAGLIDTSHAQQAFDRATTAMEGLATHGHEVERWLASQGITIRWM